MENLEEKKDLILNNLNDMKEEFMTKCFSAQGDEEALRWRTAYQVTAKAIDIIHQHLS